MCWLGRYGWRALGASPRLRNRGLTPHEHEAAGDRRGTTALHLALAICGGRQTDLLLKARAERPEAREADEEADFGDGEIRGLQQIPRALDTAPGEVGARRPTEYLAERPREVEP